MAQELQPEPRAFRGAFDQSGHIGDDEAVVVVDADHSKVRMQRRERIIGNLRPCGGHRANEGRLACIRHAQQANIGKHFQLELEIANLAFFAGTELPRRAVDARLEVKVAEPAFATLREHCFLLVPCKISDDLAGIGIGDHGADRHPQHDVVGAMAVLVGAASVLALFCAMNACEAVIDQRVDVAIGDGEDAAALAAVAAVGTAAWNVLLAPEARSAPATVAGNDFDDRFVDEFHGVTILVDTNGSVRCCRRAGCLPIRSASCPSALTANRRCGFPGRDRANNWYSVSLRRARS